MGLNTRLTVGSVILAIVLASIFGVRRAFRSLTGSNTQDDRIESVDAFQDDDGDFIASDSQQERLRQRTRAQLADARTRDENGELVLSPLQAAGTFIQRQKRIEEDPTVEGTEVAVLSISNGAAFDSTSSTSTAAQPNTITPTTQPSAPEPAVTSRPRTTAAPATAPAVPALW